MTFIPKAVRAAKQYCSVVERKADTGEENVANLSDDLENALDFIISELLELESGEGLCAITLPKIIFLTASL